MWKSDDVRALWAAHAPQLLSTFDGYPNAVQRADASRLLYMAKFGGLYADLDVTPCANLSRSIASLMDSGVQLTLIMGPPRFRGVMNLFFASRPGHPFWFFALNRLHNTSKSGDVMSSTGPHFIDRAWNEYQRAAVRESCGPLNATVRTVPYKTFERTMAGHHWSSTWHHGGEVRYDANFQLWLGVNRSNTCPEARFQELVEGTWQCSDGRYDCPLQNWSAFQRLCNGTTQSCPRAVLRSIREQRQRAQAAAATAAARASEPTRERQQRAR